jgi:hypothetical protein
MSIDKWSHENLGFNFNNKSLITAALTHPSKGGKRENIENYEKEFTKKSFVKELPNDTFPKFSDQAKVFIIYRLNNRGSRRKLSSKEFTFIISYRCLNI